MKELSEVLQDWEAVIGLEIHTELTALDTDGHLRQGLGRA